MEAIRTQSDNNNSLRHLQAVSRVRKHLANSLSYTAGKRASSVIIAVHVVGCVSVAALVEVALVGEASTGLLIACVAAVLMSLAGAGRFRTRMVPGFAGQFASMTKAVTLATTAVFAASTMVFQSGVTFQAFCVTLGGLLVAFTVADWAASAALRSLYRRGRLRSRAILIGNGRLGKELAVELELRPEYGVDIAAMIDPQFADPLDETLVESLVETKADRLILAASDCAVADPGELVDAVQAAIEMRIPTFVVPNLHEMGLGLDSMSSDRARGYPLVRVQRSAHPIVALKVKRAVDIGAATVGLLVAAPVMVVVALAVKVSSPGPVLFRQQRVGQGGQLFDIFKFRTMRVVGNQHVERQSEYRVTTMGRILRNSSLDELPQLFNIVRGDMSLVGPRPEREAIVQEELVLREGYYARHRMPMGLTGLAQVAGLRGEETDVDERVKFDNLYIDQWSLGLDMQILVKTVSAVVLQGRYRRQQSEINHAITAKIHADRRGNALWRETDMRPSDWADIV